MPTIDSLLSKPQNLPNVPEVMRDLVLACGLTGSINAVPGIDLTQYKQTLVDRFSNQAIADQLERVCSDGSSKFPKFTIPTINRLIADGQETKRAALVVAAWALYLKGVDENGDTYSIPDPRAAFCQALVADDALMTQRLLAVEEIFGTAIPRSAEFVAAFEWCCNSLREEGVTRTLQRILD